MPTKLEVTFAEAILDNCAQSDERSREQFCTFCCRGVDEGDTGVHKDVDRKLVYKFVDHDEDCIVHDACHIMSAHNKKL